jgi:phosphoglycolate phosphatase
MKESPDLVIFDWDGTVVDSTMTIAQAIRSACTDIGVAAPPVEKAAYVIGLGLQQALTHIAPGLSPSDQTALSERFRHHYLAQDQFLKPFEGMTDLFDLLHGAAMSMAVATGKSRRGLERALDVTGTRHYFETTRCADESDPKPAPTMVLEICQQLEVEPENTLVIGDTTHDIYMAKSAGANVVAVSYGAHDLQTLQAADPTHTVHSVEELQQWMKKWITS